MNDDGDLEVFNLLKQLINCKSLTPNDAGCQQIIWQRLQQLGCRKSDFSHRDVCNTWITHGTGKPIIAFAGHTDVVAAGDESLWQSAPFNSELRDGLLYGRGASDMKSGVAAMVVALERLIKAHPNHNGTLALLLTSDEEGMAIDGTNYVLKQLDKQNIKIDYAIVGEPSSDKLLGDVVRCGRRGSLLLHAVLNGVQGHVAYPEQIRNPLFASCAIITALQQHHWDSGNANFPATSFQVTKIENGVSSENVAPAQAQFSANWRYNDQHDAQSLQQKITAICDAICAAANIDIEYRWRVSAEPFITTATVLKNALQTAIYAQTGIKTTFNTTGGTSDARFFAKHGSAVVEFGASNATIHQVNEHVRVADLQPLCAIYENSVLNLWRDI